MVNSRHHQAVRDMAPLLVAVGRAPDGLVEAFQRRRGPFCGGLQWHPEDLVNEPLQAAIFSTFVRAARAAERMAA